MDLNNEINGRVYAPYIIEGRWYLKGINIGSSRCQTSSSNSQQDAKIAALEEAIKKLTDVYVSGGEWVIEDAGEYILLKYSDGREPIKIMKPIKDVTLTINKEDIFTVEGAGKYRPGTQVPLVAHLAEGYDFVGFFDGENLISNNPNHTYTIQKDVVIEARYKTITGRLTINLPPEGVVISRVTVNNNEQPIKTEYDIPVGARYSVEFSTTTGYDHVKSRSVIDSSGTMTTAGVTLSPIGSVTPILWHADVDGTYSLSDTINGQYDKSIWKFAEGRYQTPTNIYPRRVGFDDISEYGTVVEWSFDISPKYKVLKTTNITPVRSSVSGDIKTQVVSTRIPDPRLGDNNEPTLMFRSQALPYITISGLDESQIGQLVTNSTSKYKYREGNKLYFEDTINTKIPAKPDRITEYNIGAGWKKYGSGVTINSTTTLEVRYVETPKFKVLAYETPSGDELSMGIGLDRWLPTKEKLSGAHVVSEYVILPTEIGQRKVFNVPDNAGFDYQRLLYAVPSGYQISAIYDASNNRIEFVTKTNDNDTVDDPTKPDWDKWRRIDTNMLPDTYGDIVASKQAIHRRGMKVDGNSVVIIEKVS